MSITFSVSLWLMLALWAGYVILYLAVVELMSGSSILNYPEIKKYRTTINFNCDTLVEMCHVWPYPWKMKCDSKIDRFLVGWD